MRDATTVLFVLLALLACGGATIGSAPDPESQRILDEYRIKCKAGCGQLESLPEESDGETPCNQAREHDGMDCVDYCVHKMQTDSLTDPACWTKLEACADFEEKCHFGELYH